MRLFPQIFRSVILFHAFWTGPFAFCLLPFELGTHIQSLTDPNSLSNAHLLTNPVWFCVGLETSTWIARLAVVTHQAKMCYTHIFQVLVLMIAVILCHSKSPMFSGDGHWAPSALPKFAMCVTIPQPCPDTCVNSLKPQNDLTRELVQWARCLFYKQ